MVAGNARKECGPVERYLTEGIDVPTVDMVAFLTPKRSKVDIVQAVGQTDRRLQFCMVSIRIERIPAS